MSKDFARLASDVVAGAGLLQCGRDLADRRVRRVVGTGILTVGFNAGSA